MNEQIKKKEELELITQALGDETEVLRKRIRELNQKNTEFIDQEAMNRNLEAEVERLNALNQSMNKQYLDLESIKLALEEQNEGLKDQLRKMSEKEESFRGEVTNLLNLLATKISRKEILKMRDYPKSMVEVFNLDVESVSVKINQEYKAKKT